MTPTRSQRTTRHHPSAQSNRATMRRAHPSRCHARHTSSAVTPPCGAQSILPPGVTGMRPRAEQRTRPRTDATPQEAGRVWKRAPTPLASLLVRRQDRPALGAGTSALRTLGRQRQPPQRPSGAGGCQRPGPMDQQAHRRGAARPGSRHPMAAYFAVPPPRGGSPDLPSDGYTPPATMSYPGGWHYVATRVIAHMGAYSPDEMNELHWQWHQRAALRIRTAMQQHDICDILGSRGYEGHAWGHRRPRSQDVPEPPRQAARRNSRERPRWPPRGMSSPSGAYRSPLRPFAPRRCPGSPHTSGRQGSTPEQHQETRSPSRSRPRSRTPPPAARRVIFH